MFVSIRKYTVGRDSAEELTRRGAGRVRAADTPDRRLQELLFARWWSGCALIIISMFDSADEGLVSNERAADWVRNNVLKFTKGLPDVMVGKALVVEVK